jgi:hypothetical protein
MHTHAICLTAIPGLPEFREGDSLAALYREFPDGFVPDRRYAVLEVELDMPVCETNTSMRYDEDLGTLRRLDPLVDILLGATRRESR